ncbi:hemerythrin domain-containing protein [Pedomonas mirosovicensis]|uniref:hemerythrin domain-containing protein n=1 Tax=Pedomonas mirosovicensis TaxID=2908641 RepID=UPI002166D7C5|nr:hemerythrin domain-containing protein [Pedomonas mirosovicensis]MCH8684521.1 hemerythrin domain-containing protein [Pedomonas mirosovicensis]
MPTHITGGSPDMTRTTAAATGDKVADATDLLQRDHRQVESWFHACESLSDQQQKAELIQKICMALKVHTQIEEEIFYPRFRAETDEQGLVQEAIDEHAEVKRLIAEVEQRQAQGQDCTEQLREMQQCVMHHVKEEEGEMFPKARNTDIDLFALGGELATRRSELMQQMTVQRNQGQLDSGSNI